MLTLMALAALTLAGFVCAAVMASLVVAFKAVKLVLLPVKLIFLPFILVFAVVKIAFIVAAVAVGIALLVPLAILAGLVLAPFALVSAMA